MVKDPVCGMNVDPGKSGMKSEYIGKMYYFCSAACKEEFDNEPGKFAKPGENPDLKSSR
jgi:YHS domain-containing protein